MNLQVDMVIADFVLSLSLSLDSPIQYGFPQQFLEFFIFLHFLV